MLNNCLRNLCLKCIINLGDCMKWFGWFRKKQNSNKKYIKRKNVKIGLALGGGAARGIALIGVLRAFEEIGIDFDCVAGTSVGSFVGALYCYGYNSYDLENELKKLKERDIRNSKLFFMPSNTKTFEETLKKFLGGDKVFSELNKKFAAVSVNLKTGNEVRISSGSVSKAVVASCAIPGVFKPVVWEDKNLVDGGLINSIPCDVVRDMGVDYVIAVDVNRTRGEGTSSLKTLGVLNSAIGIMLKSNATKNLDRADYILYPELKNYRSSKIENINEMIEEGKDCVYRNLDIILKILNSKPMKKGKKWIKSLDIEYV